MRPDSGRTATSCFPHPFSESELEEVSAAEPGAPLLEVGRKLYQAVFSGEVRAFLAEAQARLRRGEGLRLRLRLSSEVAEWPWELLRDDRGFLALAEQTLVVRFLEHPDPVRPLLGGHPLRVLVVVSNPTGPESLDVEREWLAVQEALAPLVSRGVVKIMRLDRPTLSALLDRLKRGRFHVLHFIGHGTFDAHAGSGAVVLEDERGNAVPVTGAALVDVLGNHTSIRLVVLNACKGAMSSPGEKFSGVAQRLVRHGIPAVVAMRGPIADLSAIEFAQCFYSTLTQGWTVDRAMTEARTRMFAVEHGYGSDWAVPVLFLNSPDGRIFRPEWAVRLPLLIGLFGVLLLGLGQWTIGRMSSHLPLPERSPIPASLYCPSPKTVQMEFVRIPAGSFLMGSNGGEDDEAPRHRVTISRPFCLSAREVTQREWREIFEPNTVHTRTREDDLPVTGVSWEEAQEFVDRLNALEGSRVYRLPREAEWEYAARGPHGRSLPASNCLHGDHFDGLAPAGSYPTNDWYLYDMYGNVWEWVEDWYRSYEAGPLIDPTGPRTGEKRVKRGGSYSSASKHCRPARRGSQKPDGHHKDVGLRILRELTFSS